MARVYYVEVTWSHKGNRYPRSQAGRVIAGSVSAAANQGIRRVKKSAPGWREPEGAVFHARIVVGPKSASNSLPKEE